MHKFFRGTAATALLFGFGLAGVGCQWQAPKTATQDKEIPSASVTLHVAPKELVKLIVQDVQAPPLSLAVQSVQDGSIITGWKEYLGAMHIVHRWQERSRFRINVLPDFNDPTGTSHVDIFDETEEKPSEAQPWYPNPDLRRPERASELISAIKSHEAARR